MSLVSAVGHLSGASIRTNVNDIALKHLHVQQSCERERGTAMNNARDSTSEEQWTFKAVHCGTDGSRHKKQ